MTIPLENTRLLRVFLCHASEDKPRVQKLYRQLRDDGCDPWLDEQDLLPGQKWKAEIQSAIQQADAVIVCMSSRAVTKEGFVQREIRLSLEAAAEKPEGTIYLVPVRLEECRVPDILREWCWVDLFSDLGYSRLRRSLRSRATALKIRHGFKPPPVLQQKWFEAMAGLYFAVDRLASSALRHTLDVDNLPNSVSSNWGSLVSVDIGKIEYAPCSDESSRPAVVFPIELFLEDRDRTIWVKAALMVGIQQGSIRYVGEDEDPTADDPFAWYQVSGEIFAVFGWTKQAVGKAALRTWRDTLESI